MNPDEMKFYILHSRIDSYKRKLDKTISFIETSLAENKKLALSVSWGKDSIVLSHLLRDSRIPFVWVECGKFDDWPDTEDVMNAFVDMWPVAVYKTKALSIMEIYRRIGFYLYAETKEQKMADREYSQSFVDAIIAKIKLLGCSGSFIGLRADESDSRKLMLKKYGQKLFAKKHNCWEYFPLAWWTAKDVWAYIVTNKLPYSELYDLMPNRERARNGAMFAVPETKTYRGQLVEIKRHYPALFNEFAAEFPQARAYV